MSEFNLNAAGSLRAFKPEGAPGGIPLAGKTSAPDKSFKEVLGEKINEVNDMLVKKDIAIEDLATGKTDNVAEVLTAVEKADIAFKALMQIRNKLVDAYKEIERMQI